MSHGARILVACAGPADPQGLPRLDQSIARAGGTRLALAPQSDIVVFEGDWPGGSIELWRLAGGQSSQQIITEAEFPGFSGFVLSLPELVGAPSPGPGAGFMLVQGTFTDLAKAAAYREALPPIYAKYGGSYLALARPDAIECLAGECLAGNWQPRSIVVAMFDSSSGSQRFWYSAEYSAAKRLREGGGDFLVVAFPGQ